MQAWLQERLRDMDVAVEAKLEALLQHSGSGRGPAGGDSGATGATDGRPPWHPNASARGSRAAIGSRHSRAASDASNSSAACLTGGESFAGAPPIIEVEAASFKGLNPVSSPSTAERPSDPQPSQPGVAFTPRGGNAAGDSVTSVHRGRSFSMARPVNEDSSTIMMGPRAAAPPSKGSERPEAHKKMLACGRAVADPLVTSPPPVRVDQVASEAQRWQAKDFGEYAAFTAVNVYVLGAPGTGKTTLVHCMTNKPPAFFKAAPKVDAHSVGVRTLLHRPARAVVPTEPLPLGGFDEHKLDVRSLLRASRVGNNNNASASSAASASGASSPAAATTGPASVQLQSSAAIRFVDVPCHALDRWTAPGSLPVRGAVYCLCYNMAADPAASRRELGQLVRHVLAVSVPSGFPLPLVAVDPGDAPATPAATMGGGASPQYSSSNAASGAASPAAVRSGTYQPHLAVRPIQISFVLIGTHTDRLPRAKSDETALQSALREEREWFARLLKQLTAPSLSDGGGSAMVEAHLADAFAVSADRWTVVGERAGTAASFHELGEHLYASTLLRSPTAPSHVAATVSRHCAAVMLSELERNAPGGVSSFLMSPGGGGGASPTGADAAGIYAARSPEATRPGTARATDGDASTQSAAAGPEDAAPLTPAGAIGQEQAAALRLAIVKAMTTAISPRVAGSAMVGSPELAPSSPADVAAAGLLTLTGRAALTIEQSFADVQRGFVAERALVAREMRSRSERLASAAAAAGTTATGTSSSVVSSIVPVYSPSVGSVAGFSQSPFSARNQPRADGPDAKSPAAAAGVSAVADEDSCSPLAAGRLMMAGPQNQTMVIAPSARHLALLLQHDALPQAFRDAARYMHVAFAFGLATLLTSLQRWIAYAGCVLDGVIFQGLVVQHLHVKSVAAKLVEVAIGHARDEGLFYDLDDAQIQRLETDLVQELCRRVCASVTAVGRSRGWFTMVETVPSAGCTAVVLGSALQNYLRSAVELPRAIFQRAAAAASGAGGGGASSGAGGGSAGGGGAGGSAAGAGRAAGSSAALLLGGGGGTTVTYLLQDLHGRGSTVEAVLQAFDRECAAAGLPSLLPEDLKSTFIRAADELATFKELEQRIGIGAASSRPPAAATLQLAAACELYSAGYLTSRMLELLFRRAPLDALLHSPDVITTMLGPRLASTTDAIRGELMDAHRVRLADGRTTRCSAGVDFVAPAFAPAAPPSACAFIALALTTAAANGDAVATGAATLACAPVGFAPCVMLSLLSQFRDFVLDWRLWANALVVQLSTRAVAPAARSSGAVGTALLPRGAICLHALLVFDSSGGGGGTGDATGDCRVKICVSCFDTAPAAGGSAQTQPGASGGTRPRTASAIYNEYVLQRPASARSASGGSFGAPATTASSDEPGSAAAALQAETLLCDGLVDSAESCVDELVVPFLNHVASSFGRSTSVLSNHAAAAAAAALAPASDSSRAAAAAGGGGLCFVTSSSRSCGRAVTPWETTGARARELLVGHPRSAIDQALNALRTLADRNTPDLSLRPVLDPIVAGMRAT